MADLASSLPVRTEAAGDIIAKIADATTPSQQLAIDSNGRIVAKMDDGAGNAITSQVNGSQRALDIGINVAGVQIDPRSIRALTSSDVVTANQGGAPWSQNLTQISGATPASTNALPTRLSDGTSFYDARSIRALTSSDIITANIKDSTGAAFSVGNPLPVSVAQSGTSIHDQKTASAIAAGGSDSHDYTVTALKTLYLSQVEASASGKAKMILQIETGVATGVFTAVATQFNSTANPNMTLVLESRIPVAAGVKVRVIMSNRDVLAEDLYSTIIGSEI